MALTPTTFGRYVLLKRIAIGGMAEVFRAMAYGAEGFEKLVAIKRMLPNLSSDAQFVDMFINEAKLAANLNHANIIQIFDFGAIDELLFLSMEYIHGKNIAQIIEALASRGLTAPVELACYVIIQALNGIHHAHQQLDRYGKPANLIHRDISPPNIIVSYDGEVKIGDFGIAKATETKIRTSSGVLKGKYAYMSPEQAEGKDMDLRTDIFSLGTCFYELITLKEMFSGHSDLEILKAVRSGKIIPPRKLNLAIPKELEKILLKALRKDPSERYASASEWRDNLEHFLVKKNLRFSASWLANFMQDVFREDMEADRKLQRDEARKAEKLRPEATAIARMEISAAGSVDTMQYSTDDLPFDPKTLSFGDDEPPVEETIKLDVGKDDEPPMADTSPLGSLSDEDQEDENTEIVEEYQDDEGRGAVRPGRPIPNLMPDQPEDDKTIEDSTVEKEVVEKAIEESADEDATIEKEAYDATRQQNRPASILTPDEEEESTVEADLDPPAAPMDDLPPLKPSMDDRSMVVPQDFMRTNKAGVPKSTFQDEPIEADLEFEDSAREDYIDTDDLRNRSGESLEALIPPNTEFDDEPPIHRIDELFNDPVDEDFDEKKGFPWLFLLIVLLLAGGAIAVVAYTSEKKEPAPAASDGGTTGVAPAKTGEPAPSPDAGQAATVPSPVEQPDGGAPRSQPGDAEEATDASSSPQDASPAEEKPDAGQAPAADETAPSTEDAGTAETEGGDPGADAGPAASDPGDTKPSVTKPVTKKKKKKRRKNRRKRRKNRRRR